MQGGQIDIPPDLMISGTWDRHAHPHHWPRDIYPRNARCRFQRRVHGSKRRFIMPSEFRQDLAHHGLDTAVHHWRLKSLERIHLDRESPSLIHTCLEIDILGQLSTFFQLTFSSFLDPSFSTTAFHLNVLDHFAVITSLVDAAFQPAKVVLSVEVGLRQQ